MSTKTTPDQPDVPGGLVAYDPDGKRTERSEGKPFGAVPPKRDETRQLLTLTRMAWSTRRGLPQPPPEGATARYVGAADPAFRYERVPVLVDGEVVGTKCVWVDLRIRRREEDEARHIEAARRAHAASKRKGGGAE